MKRRRKKRIPIEFAVEELQVNFEELNTVKAWANHMGYSRSHFCRRVKEFFSKTPKGILKEVQRERIEAEILEDPEAIGFKIAVNAGLSCDKALNKFLDMHYDMTLNELRRELL